jgi:hypothetical protein
MSLVKLEVILDSFSQSQYFFLSEWKTDNLNANWKSHRISHAIPDQPGDIIVIGTIVPLLIWPHSGHRSGCNRHPQDIPDAGICSKERAFIGGSVIRGFHCKARTNNKVESLTAPILNPFLPQLFGPSYHALVFVGTELLGSLY